MFNTYLIFINVLIKILDSDVHLVRIKVKFCLHRRICHSPLLVKVDLNAQKYELFTELSV